VSWRIPLFRIAWDEEDVRSVAGVIRSGSSWADGPQVAAFEEGIAGFTGTKEAVAFNSGTSALHAALLAHGIGAGDEVIVPSFTFVATANAPLFVGATPVFADIERETLGLDPGDVAEKITNRTRAIIPVHYGGCPCRIRELREIAEDHRILLIEDAAEAFGSAAGGRMAGTFGDSAMFSFCQNKIITTGEGGAIVTDSGEVAARLRLVRSHGRSGTGDYFSDCVSSDYVSLGYNFRMPTLCAALGLSQLGKAGELISARETAAGRYRKLLHACRKECTVLNPPPGYRHVYQIFSVLAARRDELARHLASCGIMTKVYFPPAHLTHFHRMVRGDRAILPVTKKISGEILSLPFWPGIPEEELTCVAGEMERFYGECSG